MKTMTEKELQEKLTEIKNGMKLFDSIVRITDNETGEGQLTERQVDIVRKLFELFRNLSWQLKFNNYKEIRYKKSDSIDTTDCGTSVKIRPCGEKYNKKTYFGILIGEVPLSISSSIGDDNIVYVEKSFYNPAIFVPELNTIIYGCESWWGEIESEEELSELITDETIKNVWYVKLLKHIQENNKED